MKSNRKNPKTKNETNRKNCKCGQKPKNCKSPYLNFSGRARNIMFECFLLQYFVVALNSLRDPPKSSEVPHCRNDEMKCDAKLEPHTCMQ